MSLLKRFLMLISNATFFGACLAITSMALLVGADVGSKYILNQPIHGTLEIVEAYLMVAIVFLALGRVTQSRHHISVDLFVQSLSPRKRAVTDALAAILSAVFTLGLVWRGAVVAIHQTTVGEIWSTGLFDMPIWPARWLFPVGCAVMLVFFLVQAREAVLAAFTAKEDTEESPKNNFDDRESGI